MDAGFTGVVEGNCGYEVVADVCADDVVEEVGIDESEIAVDGCGCAAGESPGFVVVVRHRCIGVLEEGDCDCRGYISMLLAHGKKRGTYQSSC